MISSSLGDRLAVRRRFLALGLLGSLSVFGLAACKDAPSPGAGPAEGAATAGGKAGFHGTDITGAAYAKVLDLADVDGKPRSIEEFKGRLIFVFFGYTQCPDVCPTTMAELAQAKKLMGPEGEKVQGIFVTIDPARDTAEILRAYAQSLDPGLVALRGDDAQTAAAARAFKIFYAKVPGKTPESYTMDHTAGAYVFDTQGRVRLFERYGVGAERLSEDFRRLLAG